MRTPLEGAEGSPTLRHFNVPQQRVNESQGPLTFEQAEAIDVDSKTTDTTR